MKADVYHLEQLLDALSKKTGQRLDRTGLREISERVNIGSSYLYKYISLELPKKKKGDTLNLRDAHLDKAADFLGFKNYKDFIQSLEEPSDPLLLKCIGSYYSYVRRNAEKSVVLRSPVRVWRDKGKILFELKGPSQIFTGEVHLKHGCLFILMEAKGGKAFHHIYKIGKREQPNVLQGVFSGVSTAFDPIGGRAVLIRTDAPYISMKNATIDIPALKKSKQLEERRLAEYFKEYINNNIAPEKSYTFGLDDLGDCK